MTRKFWVGCNKHGYHTAFLKEPEYVHGYWRLSEDGDNSAFYRVGICVQAAKFLCGKQLPKPGECVEVKCSPGDLWIGI